MKADRQVFALMGFISHREADNTQTNNKISNSDKSQHTQKFRARSRR